NINRLYPDQPSELPAHAVVLSGSGPTIAVMCDPVDAPGLASALTARFPNLTAVVTTGPAPGARVENPAENSAEKDC
ncbi:MAG: hypothetical protein GX483_05000, partial [Actinomycetaceae bacterium]|nr:hypothetical protein [Actinomycetaceae bacterium]